MMFAALFKAALLALPTLAFTYPPPGPCHGNCTGHVHDPKVIRRDDGLYVRLTTYGRINIATAPAIEGPWTYQCPMLPDCSSIQLKGRCDLWAPDVIKADGEYYAFYSVSEIGSRNSDIGVASSPNMECGTWTDHGAIGIPIGSWNRIDPNFYQTSSGESGYMVWGSFWTDIWQTRMSNPPIKVLEPVTAIHLQQNTTKRPQNRPIGPCEGGYQFRWVVDGTAYHYLFFSSGACCNKPPNLLPAGEEYKVMVCRSSKPTGPFTDKAGRDCATENGGTIVLESHDDFFAPGGQGVMVDQDKCSVIMYYHYINKSVGYDYDQFQFGWNKLDFRSGWPVAVSFGEQDEPDVVEEPDTTTREKTLSLQSGTENTQSAASSFDSPGVAPSSVSFDTTSPATSSEAASTTVSTSTTSSSASSDRTTSSSISGANRKFSFLF